MPAAESFALPTSRHLVRRDWAVAHLQGMVSSVLAGHQGTRYRQRSGSTQTKRPWQLSPGFNFVPATRKCQLKQFQAEFDENQTIAKNSTDVAKP